MAPAAAAEGAGARPADDSCPPGQVQPAHFTDVAQDDAHADAIDCVVWYGIAGGVNAAEYAPAGDVSRGQMATFLRNLVQRSGGTLAPASRDYFSDDNGTTHEAGINLLAEAGIVSGRGDGRYEPQAPVERGQLATFLVNAYEHRADRTLPAGSDAFSDDNGTTHEKSIDKAAAAGFAAGVGEGRFAPGVLVGRGQLASFVTRVLDLLVEDGLTTPPPSSPGDFNLAFGDRGSRDVPFGTAYAEANDVAVGSDGSIVLAGFSSGDADNDPTGHIAVTRLDADGALDPTFGEDGRVTTPVGSFSVANAVAVQDDGKIVVAGSTIPVQGDTDSDFALVRYNADGSLDTTFGDGGTVTTSFRGPAYATELALQPDGGVLAAGSASTDRDSFNTSDFVLTRYLADGSPDTSFGPGGDLGAGGRVETDVRGGPDFLDGLVLQEDGKIVVGGTSDVAEGPSNSVVTLVRYQPDGTPDASFGDGGITSAETGPVALLSGLALQSDGSLVATGAILNAERTQSLILLAGYTADGTLDATFGDAGVVRTEAAFQSEGADVQVDGDDRIVVVGSALDDTDGSGKTWVVARYLPDGELDEAFDGDGVVRTPLGRTANAVTFQGREILAAGCDCPFPAFGRGGIESSSSFVVARFRS